MAQNYSKKITVEIRKRGRKYFKVAYPGAANEFNLMINPSSQTFQVGEVQTVLCQFETKVSKFGQKTTAIPVTMAESDAQREAERQREIQRWIGYLEQAANEGRVYQRAINELFALRADPSLYQPIIEKATRLHQELEIKRWFGYLESAAEEGRLYRRGVEELKRLGADRDPSIGPRIKQIIEVTQQTHTLAELQRWLGYVETAAQEGRVYHKGVSTLNGLGIAQYPEYRNRLNAALETARQPQAVAEPQERTVEFVSPSWSGADMMHLQPGSVFEHEGEWLFALNARKRFVREDGLSFGLAAFPK